MWTLRSIPIRIVRRFLLRGGLAAALVYGAVAFGATACGDADLVIRGTPPRPPGLFPTPTNGEEDEDEDDA